MTLSKALTLTFISLFSSAVMAANPTTIKIKGMHCGGCKAIVNKAVCESASLKPHLKKCEITVDQKIQVGTMVVEPVDGETLEIENLKKAIEGAGEDYKVSSVDTDAKATATSTATPPAPTKKAKSK